MLLVLDGGAGVVGVLDLGMGSGEGRLGGVGLDRWGGGEGSGEFSGCLAVEELEGSLGGIGGCLAVEGLVLLVTVEGTRRRPGWLGERKGCRNCVWRCWEGTGG